MTTTGRFAIDISECPSCGRNHGRTGLRPLPQPVSEDGLTYTHQYRCPQTKEQVKVARMDKMEAN